MVNVNSDVVKKSLCLTAVGISLQVIGGACFFLAALGAAKEINSQLKQVLQQKLGK